MFQNVQYEDIRQEENKIEDTLNILKNIFSVKNIVLYIITFMISMVGLAGEVSPFSLAVLAACFSCGIPAFGIIIISIIGNIIVYIDGSHMSSTYSKSMGPIIKEDVMKVLESE